MNIEKNYKLYKKYLVSYIERDGIENFIKWLDNTDAWQAPASTKYHLCEKGGFIQHSLNVFNRMIRLITEEWGDIENCPYNKETIAFVSLLHDVSKIDFYDVYFKNVKDEHGQWIQVPTYTVRDESSRLIYGEHEENSLYILRQFFNISYEEALAIRWHSGCTSDNSLGKAMEAFRSSRLALLLHIADMQATCIDEVYRTFDRIGSDTKTKDEEKISSTTEKQEVVVEPIADEQNTFVNSKYIEDEDYEQDITGTIDEADDCPF